MSDFFHPKDEEYNDPLLYDIENVILDEMPILLRLAAEADGPILDIACGTGRTTLPMAAAGYQVTGVDAASRMLARAREKAREQGLEIDFHQQDCERLDLPLTARMVTINGHAFQEFLTNSAQDNLLQSVSRHLAPGGILVFDTRFPSRTNLHKPEDEMGWGTTYDEQGRETVGTILWRWNPKIQVQEYEIIYRTTQGDGSVTEVRSTGWLRYTWPLELERLLDIHGFDLDTIYGDWDESPLANDSYDMVVIARKRD